MTDMRALFKHVSRQAVKPLVAAVHDVYDDSPLRETSCAPACPWSQGLKPKLHAAFNSRYWRSPHDSY